MKNRTFKITKRALSVILALAMVCTLTPMNSITAYADGETSYTVTPAPTTNGSFDVTVSGESVTSAAENAEVVITPTADDGYEVDTVSYNDGTGHTVANDSGYKFTMPATDVTVTVTFKLSEAAPSPTQVSVTGVSLNKTETTLTVGQDETLIKTVEPSNATDQSVVWTSSDEAVATVDSNGIVTAVATGTTTITVTTTDGNFTDTCSVTVNASITTIDTVAVTDILVPVKGSALDTAAACATSGIATAAPVVTWKVGDTEKTGLAQASTTYTAYVTLEAAAEHVFAASPTVTINGNTASVTRTDDTHITVSYTFAATAGITYPYGTNMSTSGFTLNTDEIAGTYQWQWSDTKDGSYEDIEGKTGTSCVISGDLLVCNRWYRCKLGADSYTKSVKAVKVGDENTYAFLKAYNGQWYISNETMAYSVWAGNGQFDIVGVYEHNGATYWMNTSYNRSWTVGSSESASPAKAANYFSSDQETGIYVANGVNSLKMFFDNSSPSCVRVDVDLKSGYNSFAVGTDTMLADDFITEYCDSASLKAVYDNGNLTQIQMVGAASVDTANATDPAFVFRPVTALSYYWIGSYGQAHKGEAYGNNTKEGVSCYRYLPDGTVCEVCQEDSAMAASWVNCAGSTVSFEFNIGTVADTGAVTKATSKNTSTTITVTDAKTDTYYALFTKSGDKVVDWVDGGDRNSDNEIIFSGLNPDTEYVVKTVLKVNKPTGSEPSSEDVETTEVRTNINPLIPSGGSGGGGTSTSTVPSYTTIRVNNPISGYTYKLLDSDGNYIKTAVPDGDGLVFEDLDENTTYYIVATSANNSDSDRVEVHTLAQGGGGGGSSSSSYTVPVESGSESAPVAAIIKDDVAVVETISDSVINDVVEKGKTDTLTINLSGADDKVRGAVLDKETVEKISDVLNDKTNKVEALEIKTPTATITVDSKALNTISNAAGDGDSIRLVVEDAGDVTSELTSAQKKSIEGSNTLLMVDAYVLVGSTVIHNLGGGTITVTMEYPFDSSVDASLVTLTHMLDNGKAVQIPWKKVKAGGEQLVEFVTDSLSYFAFTIDEKAVEKKQNEKNGLVLNEEFKVRQYGSEIKVSWGAVDGADGYLVYATYCGNKFGKPVKTISNKDVTSVRISKLNGKALDLTGEFKVYVKAYKLVDGKKVAFGRTITAHIAGRKNKEYTNIQAIKVNTTRVSLKVGNTKQIKASLVLVNNVKSELNSYHGRQFRYASSDESVASVDKNGKITAKGSGTCYIYVYAKNGYARKIKVTVH